MNSTSEQGRSNFVAQAGDVTSTSIIRQVPGDPCGLKMSAQPSGQQLELKTEPVSDCSGNAVPDGTIVTFTEIYAGWQSTVDVPLKRDIAEVEMPAHKERHDYCSERSGIREPDSVGEVSMLKCSGSMRVACRGPGLRGAQATVNVETPN